MNSRFIERSRINLLFAITSSFLLVLLRFSYALKTSERRSIQSRQIKQRFEDSHVISMTMVLDKCKNPWTINFQPWESVFQ